MGFAQSVIIILFAVSLLGGGGTAPFPVPDAGPKNIGQLSYGKADAFVKENAASWRSIWEDFLVDPLVAESVIYPELIRYSYWQDEIEKAVVSASYNRLGHHGADYSVGHFQMKASWVEKLERRWMDSALSRELEIYFDTSDSQFARKARLDRLKDEDFWQPVYLALFLRMLYEDFPELSTVSIPEQVRLCATAYNNGVDFPGKGRGELLRIQRWNHLESFHTDFIATGKTKKYCYADLALEHYNQRKILP